MNYLIALGAESFLHLPDTTEEMPSFLEALKKIAAGTPLRDLRVIPNAIAIEMRESRNGGAGILSLRGLQYATTEVMA